MHSPTIALHTDIHPLLLSSYLSHRHKLSSLIIFQRMVKMLLAFASLLGLSLAQRPSYASTCDYYAQVRYGVNNSNTQFQLMQDIVILSFGGSFHLNNFTTDVTGILNPGYYQGTYVNLMPFFNGSIQSSNLNGQPVGIDWLDDGGTVPLYNFLSGQAPNLVLTNKSNQ